MSISSRRIGTTKQDEENKNKKQEIKLYTSCKVDLLIYSWGGHEFFLQWKMLPLTMLPRHRTLSEQRERDQPRKINNNAKIKKKKSLRAWCVFEAGVKLWRLRRRSNISWLIGENRWWSNITWLFRDIRFDSLWCGVERSRTERNRMMRGETRKRRLC